MPDSNETFDPEALRSRGVHDRRENGPRRMEGSLYCRWHFHRQFHRRHLSRCRFGLPSEAIRYSVCRHAPRALRPLDNGRHRCSASRPAGNPVRPSGDALRNTPCNGQTDGCSVCRHLRTREQQDQEIRLLSRRLGDPHAAWGYREPRSGPRAALGELPPPCGAPRQESIAALRPRTRDAHQTHRAADGLTCSAVPRVGLVPARWAHATRMNG